MITLPSASHFCVLFAITFFRDVRDVVVQSAGRKGMAHGKQSVHSICCLADLDWTRYIGMTLGRVYNFVLPDRIDNFLCDIVASA